MLVYNIVLNRTLKKFWIAEPKYSEKLNDIVSQFEGKFDITYYPSSNIKEDIIVEEHRGYKKSHHYLDWDLKQEGVV